MEPYPPRLRPKYHILFSPSPPQSVSYRGLAWWHCILNVLRTHPVLPVAMEAALAQVWSQGPPPFAKALADFSGCDWDPGGPHCPWDNRPPPANSALRPYRASCVPAVHTLSWQPRRLSSGWLNKPHPLNFSDFELAVSCTHLSFLLGKLPFMLYNPSPTSLLVKSAAPCHSFDCALL